MSFSILLEKNEDGTYDIKSSTPETLPDKLRVDGHVEEGQVVDLSVRASGLFASTSRRAGGLY